MLVMLIYLLCGGDSFKKLIKYIIVYGYLVPILFLESLGFIQDARWAYLDTPEAQYILRQRKIIKPEYKDYNYDNTFFKLKVAILYAIFG